MKAKADMAPDHVRRTGFGGGTTTRRRVQTQTWVRDKPRPAEPGAGKALGQSPAGWPGHRGPQDPARPGHQAEEQLPLWRGGVCLPQDSLRKDWGPSRRGQLGSLQTGMWPWWSPLTRLTLAPLYHVPESKVQGHPCVLCTCCCPRPGPGDIHGALALGVHQGLPASALHTAAGCPASLSLLRWALCLGPLTTMSD